MSENFENVSKPELLSFEYLANELGVSCNSDKEKILIQEEENQNIAFKSGIESLDRIIQGFRKGSLCILGGRPGLGKTSLMLDIALNTARSGKNVYIFSLEMSAKQIETWLISKCLGINLENNLNDYINNGCLQEIGKLPIYVCDWILMSVDEIEKIIRNNNIENGIVFIDYLQLVSLSQYQTDALKTLKKLANDTDTSIVVLSQLSRIVERRNDKRPLLSDLLNLSSSSDADYIIMIYRDGYYNSETDSTYTELILEKNRYGKTGTAYARYDGCSLLSE